MTAIKTAVLICFLCSLSSACIPTMDPDADEWDPDEMTTIITTFATTTEAPTTTPTTTAAPMCPDTSWRQNTANGYCYLALPASTINPETECSGLGVGAHAASIADMTENMFILMYLSENYAENDVYIGGISSGPPDDESTWSWSDMSQYNWANWDYAGMWPVSNSAQVCMTFSTYAFSPGLWYNFDCNRNYVRLCKVMAM